MTGLNLFLVFVTSLLVTFGTIPWVLRFARAWQLFDHPDLVESAIGSPTVSRRVHSTPIPRLGGIGMVLGFFISVLLWLSESSMKPIYLSSLIMFATGFIDDIKPLSAKIRLFIQFFAASIIVFGMKIPVSYLNLWGTFGLHLPDWAAYGLSTFIIVGAINSVNLMDGLDGLASGVVLIGVLNLSMMYFLTTGDLNLIIAISLPLLGALLGFLKYNTYPASIFMGDGGSNWLGLIMGSLLVILLSGAHFVNQNPNQFVTQSETVVPFVCALLCMAVPVFDTGSVLLRRFLAGKSLMSPDKTHFHHTLMNLGLSHSQSVLAIYFLAMAIGVLGLLPVSLASPSYEWIAWVAVGVIVVVQLITLNFQNARLSRMLELQKLINLKPLFGGAYQHLVDYLEVCNRYLIYFTLSVIPLVAGVPQKPLGWAALLGVIVVIAVSIGKQNEENFFQSFAVSLATTILLTAINSNLLHVSLMGTVYQIQHIYNAVFIILFVTTFLYFFLTLRLKYIIVTPTDFLLIILPVSLLFIPEPFQSEFHLKIISVRSLIFFFAMRTLTRRYEGSLRRIKFMSAVSLAFIFLVSVCELRFVY